MPKNSSKLKVWSSELGVGAYSYTPLQFVMIAVLIIGGITVTGCNKAEEANVQITPVKKAVVPVQHALDIVKKADYIYDPAGKRDPFKAFIVEAGKKASPVAPATPLQSYDLSALRLVGIMMLPGKKVAIIEDPTGKGYHIKEGTPIGLNDGVVVKILNDEVVVEENYLDESAQTKKRMVSVKIPKEQGQGGEDR